MRHPAKALVVVLLLTVLTIGFAQQPVPDAPSAARPAPANPFPADTAPAPKIPERPVQEEPPPAQPAAGAANEVPALSANDKPDITVVTTLVIVPVTVKDSGGRLVEGLLRRDFRVFEDGQEQPIRFFTSDPFPLSAAIVVDRCLPSTVMKKVNDSLPAVVGAFSEFDEVSFYSYCRNVERHIDYGAAGDRLAAAISETRKERSGKTGGVPVTSGPMASGPTINGRPFDPGAPRVVTPPRESRVLNDAILAAAIDLGRRDRSRRKVIFVISDGAESGSNADINEVRKVLLSNEITVYGVGVGSAAIPGYGRAQQTKIPGFSFHGNLLPQYVQITGGDVLTEFSRNDMEQAYARITEMSRNQYTLGYRSPSSAAASNYRSIEVRVQRPNLRVIARDGYFPLPPPRQQNQ